MAKQTRKPTPAPFQAHPWEGEITDWCVVSRSGLSLTRFADETAARGFAEGDHSGSDYIHAVYGPGLRNRVAVFMGVWYTPAEFDKVRGF